MSNTTDQATNSPGEAGLLAARSFIAAFNKQNHEELAGTLNYPHTRLAKGKFFTISSAADFIALSHKGEDALHKEGWGHTTIGKQSIVHEGPDKVHMALSIHRHRADTTIYNTFDTMWIATLNNGHWGIQFRSSYLR